MVSHYVGIDISAYTATIAWQDPLLAKPTVITIQQTPKAYQRLARQLQPLADPDKIHIVMVATGSYWMAIAHFLFDAGFAVSVVNPTQPKKFAELQLKRAKTDALLLMEFAQFCQPDLWTPPPPICETLRQYLTCREQVIDMQTQLRNRLHAFDRNPHADPVVRRILQEHLDRLTHDIQQLKLKIEQQLQTHSQWQQAADYLMSIPGIGSLSTAWLLVATHCFIRCDTPQQAASFAGLAPHAKDSGNYSGKRYVGGKGHESLRNVLYMASAPASRFNPILKPYYDKLVARGKPKKVARCAVARKLIHIAWACVTKQCYFDPDFAKPSEQVA